ncbi:S-adenosyl-L-methionine-dependent methyltransferase [Umbelopsis sp. PMI_123]|nr:S-adenosyl-L-methionine-dependent methyltransferase [Umbelopsis sp. PMI_123]
MSRPEHIAPPEIFYGETEAVKYTENSRIAAIQAEMAYRALELLNLPEDEPAYILDIGCGSGLSGEILEEEGHIWVGMDIAPSMLDVAKEREVEGDLFLQDAGQGMAFRPGTFDGAISISVLQWLCNADKQINNPKSRIQRFFSTLYSSLRRGARAVFQFYPENDDQIQMLTDTASKCGFEGGLLVDYPNSKKAKKYYLCLFAGQADGVKNRMPTALGEDGSEHPAVASVEFEKRRIKERRRSDKRRPVKDKQWILHKKETVRARGNRVVVADSKYTGRKRKPRF